MSEFMLQDLIGRQVLDQNGNPIGHIEEVVAARVGNDLLVSEYHIGAFALLERLSSGEIGRSFLRFLGAGRGDGMAVPWDRLDLTSLDRPKLTCDVNELRPPQREAPNA
ncbi:PRC-barrel domain-containing protein [Rhizobium sp. B230/85]|uniref:PRC-barrel domain-containing protein n=1 Tax=unclassified Rhizobium TaxID=2613769 RepID=UPI001ADC925B|nr:MULTISPECIES: PRC-barrel domain-containing protein [unclassified Rhizobium]MBO9136491.1 PRC-barrel domain-containing protein [Rhizobium sp. B209b/85]QXZ98563.1 PRC-barrel domain-containing protein [Rhizobium sp. B230/85]